MLLSTHSILDLFRAWPTGFHNVAGEGPDRRSRALDRVHDPQVGVPALAEQGAAGIAAQAALEEADVRVVARCLRKPLLLLAPELTEVPTSSVATTGRSWPRPGSRRSLTMKAWMSPVSTTGLAGWRSQRNLRMRSRSAAYPS
jgi:hypothetical protein